MADEWGPLGALAGEWEGEGGLDTAFSHAEGKVLGSPYLEKCTMKPFGPVDNGSQHLYGLDYRSAMWRGDEENPFHTEVGYWLWDAATGEVVDRIAGIEESRASARRSSALAVRIAEAQEAVEVLRQAFLAKRVERRQTETLIEETEARDQVETERRGQRDLDDWFLSRAETPAEKPRDP